jgi:hypothetical protein
MRSLILLLEMEGGEGLAECYLLPLLTPQCLKNLMRSRLRWRPEVWRLFYRRWAELTVQVWGPSVGTLSRSLILPQLSLNFKLNVPMAQHLVQRDGGLKVQGTTVLCGTVEGSSRCVASNSPFPVARLPATAPEPKPKAKTSLPLDMSNSFRRMFMFAVSMAMRATSRKSAPSLKAEEEEEEDEGKGEFSFVVPFRLPSGMWFLSPRTIAYYEVSIAALPKVMESDAMIPISHSFSFANALPTPTLASSECVAVGLAAEGFIHGHILPGWNKYSYGYHSDDGAIFHGHGRAIKNFGPVFGKGDVVGCGLDYRRREIFFTLNGRLLGVAFTDVNVSKPLYPTVGIDSACRATFNFGAAPFAFPLQVLC